MDFTRSDRFRRKELISVIIPVYNEENNIERAYLAVCKVFTDDLNNNYDFEIIFTDNHSTDATYEKIKNITATDKRVRVARFTKNFGFNKSLLTGYRLAKGDAAIQLDCDLQDPPALFVQLIEYWKKGHDVVVGIRTKRPEGRILQGARKIFYRFLMQISEDNLIADGGDFRLISREILDQLVTIHDATPYVRGLISSIAANQIGIPYTRKSREHDKSKFPLVKLFSLAIDGVVNHSTVPLRLASYLGFFVAIVTACLASIYLLGRIAFGFNWPSGFATEVILILFGISLNAIFLGIIGEYISRIYQQLKQRPITIIESAINLNALPTARSLEE
ncbi:glycosyltransferase family 2 protein [Spartinivicinus poritis]|uniref:Glycosyltransferase family 2 protein n=1 Tax=Spartinivicinus poritis TaxID=2994640 RepID=A0ABT5U7C5_9GAMM|nr:glycosyltransferase family 2 protein [Spartinivicinus sp. A2-2]MDE1462274.1 glycosyltransferase family 2 protein [Spartinivicinus sp. A2-2]